MNVTPQKHMAQIVWCLTYCVVHVITPTDNVDNNDNECSKLETLNVITINIKTMEEKLVETIINII